MYLFEYTPKSSNMHCYTESCRHSTEYRSTCRPICRPIVSADTRSIIDMIRNTKVRNRKFTSSETLCKSIIKLKSRTRRYWSLFSCNRVVSLQESNTCSECTDIETNPGPRPMCVDAGKTIAAPYSQGNELVFEQNVGQQCVAMSLCSLISNNKQGVSSANGLIKIVNIGNQ